MGRQQSTQIRRASRNLIQMRLQQSTQIRRASNHNILKKTIQMGRQQFTQMRTWSHNPMKQVMQIQQASRNILKKMIPILPD